MCFSRFKNGSRRDCGILNVELGFQCQHRLTSVVPYSSWSPAQLRSESELGRGVVIVGRSPLHATPPDPHPTFEALRESGEWQVGSSLHPIAFLQHQQPLKLERVRKSKTTRSKLAGYCISNGVLTMRSLQGQARRKEHEASGGIWQAK